MGLQAGIVGLPNVGKSTLFSALTAAVVDRANYPFTTVEPNVGVVPVPDPRLDRLASHFDDRQAFPATVEIVDLAGLVRGASQGEGLGNQFLSHARGVNALLHVVRCFDDPDVAHIEGRVDPEADIEAVNLELVLADLEVVDRRLERMRRAAKGGTAESDLELLKRLHALLDGGGPVRSTVLSDDDRVAIRELQLLTAKPVLYVCNVSEGERDDSSYIDAVRRVAEEEGAGVISISSQLEAEIAELDREDRAEFLADAGVEQPGPAVLAQATYRLLGLLTFFTTPTEVRAWELTEGGTAVEAAERIHTDFASGFVKADVYRIGDLEELSSEQEVRAAGRMRTEGRDYVVQDGDVMLFKIS